VLLEKEMNAKAIESTDRNLRLLSQAWYSAREDDKAIPPLVQAAKMTNDGELYVRIAQANLNLENWGEATAAARKGIQLGGLKRQDTAYLMLGMALLNEKKLEQARDAFAAAGRDNRSERAAQQWIKHVDSEIQRRDLLNQEVEYEEREKDKLLETLEGEQ
jgi:tetratricopeptide (TPR) repeat protein